MESSSSLGDKGTALGNGLTPNHVTIACSSYHGLQVSCTGSLYDADREATVGSQALIFLLVVP